jgi:hypothetical protein
MKKILIIIFSVIVLAFASVFGFVYYHSIPSKEYKTEHFSFKVPKSFKFVSNPLLGNNEYLFESLGAKIYIHDININCTPDATGEYLKSFSDDKNIVIEKLTDCSYKGYFYSAESNTEGNDKLHMEYILGTNTYFLEISVHCMPSAESRIKSAINRIVKKVEYTSDYRISAKPDVYDFDYISINAGSKYICTDKTKEFEGRSVKRELVLTMQFTETDNINILYYPKLNISVVKNPDTTPAEDADVEYDSVKDIEEKEPVRDQKELFGINCEHVSFRYNFASDDEEKDWINCDKYFFEKDGISYFVSAIYRKGSDEADIKEMLDSITIK